MHQDKIFDALADNAYTNCVGGYGAFTQDDVRGYDEARRCFTVQLLQLNSDDDDFIMWGDMGTALFFIRPDDLRRRDFSKVLYVWDCY